MSSHCIKVRGEPPPERMPPLPRQMHVLKSSPNHPPSDMSALRGSPLPELRTTPTSGLPMDLRYSSKISAKAGITGRESRLARVFGRLTTDIQIDRLITTSVPV